MRATEASGTKKPLILICNDDGIDARGIQALAHAIADLGDVRVVAPETEQSAVGHAITIREPVRAHEWSFQGPAGLLPAHAVTGTPADCVKLAVDKLMPRVPDLVVSGINQGPNTAVNVIYSGTVSAATEAAILGIDAIAVSLCAWKDGDFALAGRITRSIVQRVLASGLPPGVLLNINIPDVASHEIRGMRITRQARSRWEENFSERVDPFDRPYYWMTGRFVNLDEGDNTDLTAVEDGYVSITPIQHDLTAHRRIKELQDWNWEEPPYGDD